MRNEIVRQYLRVPGADYNSADECVTIPLPLMLKIRDEGRKMPVGAFLLSPWTDMTMSGNSYIRNYHKDVEIGEKKAVLTEEKRKKLMESDLYSFIGDADRKSPYISPLFGSYEGFPPMFFAVGEHEMLLDDTLGVVKKLKKLKIPVICERKPDMFHTYVLYKNMMPESRSSFSLMKRFIQENFADTPAASDGIFCADGLRRRT